MESKRILVCGGTGFLGTNLCQYFSNSHHEIFATKHIAQPKFQSKKVNYRTCDLTDKFSLQDLFVKVQPHIVINAAAVTSGSKDILEQPFLHITDNVIINSLLFEQCYKSQVEHCIFLSCSTMYPSSKKPQTEWDANNEVSSPYYAVAAMKLFCEQLCQFYSWQGDTKFTAIRHSNIYGPHDRFEFDKAHMVASMIRKTLEFGEIQVNGGPSNEPRRDILYVDDLCNFIDLCIEKQTNNYELLNCGYGEAFSVTKIINMIQQAAGTDKCISYNCDKQNIPTTTILDCTKAKKLLNWVPRIDIFDGLQATINWYKSIRDTRLMELYTNEV